jgi:regulator of replication initiation timing
MDTKNHNIERLQTRINMIRDESRHLSYQIEAIQEKRHNLQLEKAKLKDRIVELTTAQLVE